MISRSISILLSISILVTPLVSGKNQRCKALALSGGANKGAYESGLLYGFSHSDKAADYEYEVITGVSAGAINAGAISVWDHKDSV